MAKETVLQRDFFYYGAEDRMKTEKVLSERDIIESVKKGNKEVYQSIVKFYMKRAYYIALGFVHNHQDALDVSQKAFIKAFRKIKNFDSNKSFFPWFYRLLRNICIDHLKSHRYTSEIPLEAVQVLERANEDREMKEAIWKGIEKLEFDQREVIILYYFQQFSYKEIAEFTGKPLGTVMSCLYYSKKKLKGIIIKYLGLE